MRSRYGPPKPQPEVPSYVRLPYGSDARLSTQTSVATPSFHTSKSRGPRDETGSSHRTKEGGKWSVPAPRVPRCRRGPLDFRGLGSSNMKPSLVTVIRRVVY